MRYYEIASAVRVPVSGEEHDLLNRADTSDGLASDTLDERDAEVARRMLARGLFRDDDASSGTTVYRCNSSKDIWRDRDDR